MNINVLKLISGITVRGWRIIARRPQVVEHAPVCREDNGPNTDAPFFAHIPDDHPANLWANEASSMIRSIVPASWEAEVKVVIEPRERLVFFHVYLQAPDGIQLGNERAIDWKEVTASRMDIKPMFLRRLLEAAQDAVQLWESEKISAIIHPAA